MPQSQKTVAVLAGTVHAHHKAATIYESGREGRQRRGNVAFDQGRVYAQEEGKL